MSSADCVVVKAQYRDELRRFSLPRAECKYSCFEEKISVLFGADVCDLLLKYLDDDGDWVTFSSHSEFSEAMRVVDSQKNNVLRLKVLPREGSSASLHVCDPVVESSTRSTRAYQHHRDGASTVADPFPLKEGIGTKKPKIDNSPVEVGKAVALKPSLLSAAASMHSYAGFAKDASGPLLDTKPSARNAAAYATFKNTAPKTFASKVKPNPTPKALLVPQPALEHQAVLADVCKNLSKDSYAACKMLGPKMMVKTTSPKGMEQLVQVSEVAEAWKKIDKSSFAAFKMQSPKMAAKAPAKRASLPQQPSALTEAWTSRDKKSYAIFKQKGAHAPDSSKAMPKVDASALQQPHVSVKKSSIHRKTVTQVALEKKLVSRGDVKRARKCSSSSDKFVRDLSRAVSDIDKEVQGLAKSFENFLFGGKTRKFVSDLANGIESTANDICEATIGEPAFGPRSQKSPKRSLMVDSIENAVDACSQLVKKAGSECDQIVEVTALELAPLFDMLSETLRPWVASFNDSSADMLLVRFTSIISSPDLEAAVTEFVNTYIRPYLDMILEQFKLTSKVTVSVNYTALVKMIVEFISSLRIHQIGPLLEAFFKEFCVLVFEMHKNMKSMESKRLMAPAAGEMKQQGALMPSSVDFGHLERFLDVICNVLTADQISVVVRGLHTSFKEVVPVLQTEAQRGRFGTLMGRLLPSVDMNEVVDKVCSNPTEIREINKWAPFLTTYFASLSASQPVARKGDELSLSAPAQSSPVATAVAPSPLKVVNVPEQMSCEESFPPVFSVMVSQERNFTNLQNVAEAVNSMPCEAATPEPQPTLVVETAKVAEPLSEACSEQKAVQEVVKQICNAALVSVVERSIPESPLKGFTHVLPVMDSLADSYVSCEEPEKKMGSSAEDVNLTDGSEVLSSTTMTKTWRLRNSGDLKWPSMLELRFIGGDRMDQPDAVSVPPLSPTEECDVSVEFTAPSSAGRFVSYWKLFDGDESFGRRMWLDISVAQKAEDSDDFVLVDDDDDDDAMSFMSVGETFMYPEQMDILVAKGFEDKFANDQVLIRCGGSVDDAVEDLKKLESAMEMLDDLGVADDREECIHLLLKHNYDNDAVVNDILCQ